MSERCMVSIVTYGNEVEEISCSRVLLEAIKWNSLTTRRRQQMMMMTLGCVSRGYSSGLPVCVKCDCCYCFGIKDSFVIFQVKKNLKN